MPSVRALAKQSPILKDAVVGLRNLRYRLQGKPIRQLPSAMRNRFSLNGQIEVLERYSDDSRSEPLVYKSQVIDANCARIKRGECGHYNAVDSWLYAALKKYPINGNTVAIIGSNDQGFGPWYECICLSYGAIPTTIEYNSIDFRDQRIKYLKAPLKLPLPQFDAAFSISAFEHDGLGRYGDKVDPDGDLKAMALMKRIVKPGGLLFLSVISGKDKVVFNWHRIYGRIRLPLLLKGWTVLNTFGLEDKFLDRDTGDGWNPMVNGQPLHPDYQSYEPIWVLRN